MKQILFIIFSFTFITSCSKKNPDIYTDSYLGIFPIKATDCSGKTAQWNMCYQAAQRECPSGYKIYEMKKSLHYSAPGPNIVNDAVYEMKHGKGSSQFIRQLLFRCNK